MEASQPGGEGQHAPRRKGWELRKAARMMPHTLLELCGKTALLLGGKRASPGPWMQILRPPPTRMPLLPVAQPFQIPHYAGLPPDQHRMRLTREPLQARPLFTVHSACGGL